MDREEPGGPQSMGSQRAGHDWATNTHKLRAIKVAAKFSSKVWRV